MDAKGGRTLAILTAVDGMDELTQRLLAKRLNVSVGTANGLVQKLVDKDWISLNRRNGKARYSLTDSGRAERLRLLGERQAVRLRQFVKLRNEMAAQLSTLLGEARRLVFYGAGDVAQVAYVAAMEDDFEVVAVIDEDLNGERFLDLIVQPLEMLQNFELKFDAVVITAKNRNERNLELLERFHLSGIPVLDVSC